MTGQHDAPSCPHGELAVGWALHALEPEEETLVADHLPDCTECTRTVAETEYVGAALGLSIPEATPSADLEQRILAGTTTPPHSPIMSLASPTRAAPHIVPKVTGEPSGTPPAPSGLWRAPRQRQGRKPICWPEVVMLLLVGLLAMALAVAIVFVLI